MQQTDTLARLSEEQTKRAVAEDGLRQSQKLNAVGQLTAGIAHDFNNLLTGIGGALEMMGRRVASPSDDFLRFLDLAKTGASRAATLTHRLLAFSRQQPLQVDAVDANKVVSGMSELLRRTPGEQGTGLSMAFGYVKQVGGHLKIYSEAGHGTAVKIYLPSPFCSRMSTCRGR
jgi:signal transduction histidine kinase